MQREAALERDIQVEAAGAVEVICAGTRRIAEGVSRSKSRVQAGGLAAGSVRSDERAGGGRGSAAGAWHDVGNRTSIRCGNAFAPLAVDAGVAAEGGVEGCFAGALCLVGLAG